MIKTTDFIYDVLTFALMWTLVFIILPTLLAAIFLPFIISYLLMSNGHWLLAIILFPIEIFVFGAVAGWITRYFGVKF